MRLPKRNDGCAATGWSRNDDSQPFYHRRQLFNPVRCRTGTCRRPAYAGKYCGDYRATGDAANARNDCSTYSYGIGRDTRAETGNGTPGTGGEAGRKCTKRCEYIAGADRYASRKAEQCGCHSAWNAFHGATNHCGTANTYANSTDRYSHPTNCHAGTADEYSGEANEYADSAHAYPYPTNGYPYPAHAHASSTDEYSGEANEHTSSTHEYRDTADWHTDPAN